MLIEKTGQGYRDVPPGSTLRVWVEGTAGAFQAEAWIFGPSDDDAHFTFAEIFRPTGTAIAGRDQLDHAGSQYVVRVLFRFNTQNDSKAVATIDIVDANGSQVRPPITATVTAKRSDGAISVFFGVATT